VSVTQRVTVTRVEADVIDVSTGFDSIETVTGRVGVQFTGGGFTVSARDWRSLPRPNVGDTYVMVLDREVTS
jgi:hypothetical protein